MILLGVLGGRSSASKRILSPLEVEIEVPLEDGRVSSREGREVGESRHAVPAGELTKTPSWDRLSLCTG